MVFATFHVAVFQHKKLQKHFILQCPSFPTRDFWQICFFFFAIYGGWCARQHRSTLRRSVPLPVHTRSYAEWNPVRSLATCASPCARATDATRRSKCCACAKGYPACLSHNPSFILWWNTDSARQPPWWVAPCQNRPDSQQSRDILRLMAEIFVPQWTLAYLGWSTCCTHNQQEQRSHPRTPCTISPQWMDCCKYWTSKRAHTNQRTRIFILAYQRFLVPFYLDRPAPSANHWPWVQ